MLGRRFVNREELAFACSPELQAETRVVHMINDRTIRTGRCVDDEFGHREKIWIGGELRGQQTLAVPTSILFASPDIAAAIRSAPREITGKSVG